MSAPDFKIIDSSTWQLSNRVDKERKSLLLGTSFHEIVELVVSKAIWTRCRKKPIFKYPSLHRAELELQLPPELVDLFHSGAGGYRAQYYVSAELGERANECILAALLPKLKDIGTPHSKESCDWPLVEASLKDPDAKIWIYEGAWLSDNRAVDRNLAACNWEKNAPKVGLDKRFEASWVKLTPEKENRLELKGGCVTASLKSGGVVLKPERSDELHTFGFT